MAPVGSLHEISMILGRLTGQTEGLLDRIGNIYEKLEDLQEKSALTLAAVEGLKQRLEVVEKTIETKVMPSINDYKRAKQRGLGMLSMAGLIGGGLTAIGPRLIKMIFGE